MAHKLGAYAYKKWVHRPMRRRAEIPKMSIPEKALVLKKMDSTIKPGKNTHTGRHSKEGATTATKSAASRDLFSLTAQ